jgi:rhodanese-related sulfurtransferase
MSPDLRRILLEACVLIAFGCLVGLSLHYQLVFDAFEGRLTAPQRSVEVDAQVQTLPTPVLLDEIPELLAAGALLVDARAPELYLDGHLPDAVSLPMVEIDASFLGFQSRVPAGQTLIVYCSGFGCPDSFDLGLYLIEAGYRDVRVFEGGFPEWQDSGLSVEGKTP